MDWLCWKAQESLQSARGGGLRRQPAWKRKRDFMGRIHWLSSHRARHGYPLPIITSTIQRTHNHPGINVDVQPTSLGDLFRECRDTSWGSSDSQKRTEEAAERRSRPALGRPPLPARPSSQAPADPGTSCSIPSRVFTTKTRKKCTGGPAAARTKLRHHPTSPASRKGVS
ncbi:hypothetical protein PtB15_4B132 [Puccinia triticina]|nr:hypothetical protein PtB15_4B132 [Puccinia triticina]